MPPEGTSPPPVPPPLPAGSQRLPPLPRLPSKPAPPSSPPFLQKRGARLPDKPGLLSPTELERFKNLLVFAQATVEGYFSGKHKSPYRGASAEFADYKEYVAGDDLAHLDWRVYGRSRKLFIRQYEEETDMVIYLLVDTSASMKYAGEKRQSKYVLAAKIAAALTYLMIRQGDKTSLVTFADTVRGFQAPGGTRRHLFNVVSQLEAVQPADGTGLVSSLQECQSLFKKRGRLVILSDFLTNLDSFFDELGFFQHRKFEILLLHILDPDELELPQVDVARFVDLETAEQIQVEPEEIRRAYRQTMEDRLNAMARRSSQTRVRHALVDTRRPYLDAIEAYLGFRSAANAVAGMRRSS